MFGPRFNPARCETQCRLCSQRIKLLRNKKQTQLKQMRKDIAELLKNGKQEFARIRVEAVIRENAALQGYEILELFLELLAVRAPLMAKSKEIPRDLIESVSSIIYAAQRVPDLPELPQLRAMLGSKFGKEYVSEASSDVHCSKWQVNEKLIECLTIEAPAGETKLEVLTDIAQEYGVDWDANAAARDLLPPTMQYAGGYAPQPQVQQQYAPQPMPQQYTQMQPPPAQFQAQRPAFPVQDARFTTSMALEAARNAQQAADQAIQSSYEQASASGASRTSAPQVPPKHGGSSLSHIPPPEEWLKGPSQPNSSTSSPPPSFTDAAPASTGPPAATGPPPPLFGGLTAKKTNEDIQKAYDSAPGPPQKPASAPPAASAPPPLLPSVPPSGPPSLPSAPVTDLDLPSTPGAGKAASPQDELDDLQRRFNALKNL